MITRFQCREYIVNDDIEDMGKTVDVAVHALKIKYMFLPNHCIRASNFPFQAQLLLRH
jgi:hypothetical protein